MALLGANELNHSEVDNAVHSYVIKQKLSTYSVDLEHNFYLRDQFIYSAHYTLREAKSPAMVWQTQKNILHFGDRFSKTKFQTLIKLFALKMASEVLNTHKGIISGRYFQGIVKVSHFFIQFLHHDLYGRPLDYAWKIDEYISERGQLNKETKSYQYGDSHYKDRMVSWGFNLYIRIPISSLYLNGALAYMGLIVYPYMTWCINSTMLAPFILYKRQRGVFVNVLLCILWTV